jgi:uncharacterized peroxidase-related enzyme
MARIEIPSVEQVPAKSKPLLEAVRAKLGSVPNLFRIVAHSPAALEGYLGLNGALGGGALDVKTRERIALAVAEVNGCNYCLSAHCYLGKNVAKLDDEEMSRARDGRSADPKADVAVGLARKIALGRGRIAEADLALAREKGLSEAEVVEVITNVALNVLTNYVNNALETDIDFPVVEARPR